ncbi:ER membrane protein DP1/Yop1 [Emydomyces testavorans]|uniref:ER membrane protein DP1/Yop1 n=1 Tax=Emydomyces testavorans TaxID=2070801 RepID=A0AAF0IJA5_9EURO|nr:ER membrane protein DP1/Yop1 [Emydomyces testavorans]
MSFQDRAQHQIAQIDKELSKYPILNNFERQTSVPKVYAFLGLVGIYFFLVFFNIAGEFLVNFAGFLIPGYYSLNALFTTTKSDDTQFVLILWMALPQTHGAEIVFGSLIQPLFSRYFQSGSTSANLRSQADQATKEHST